MKITKSSSLFGKFKPLQATISKITVLVNEIASDAITELDLQIYDVLKELAHNVHKDAYQAVLAEFSQRCEKIEALANTEELSFSEALPEH